MVQFAFHLIYAAAAVTGNPLQRFVSYTAQFQALAKQWNRHVFLVIYLPTSTNCMIS